MHCRVRVRQLIIKIFINITCCMGEIVLNVVNVHHVVVDEATAILLLRLEVKPHVIPVSWPDFVVGV